MALKNPCVLNTLTAQQGGACAIIGEVLLLCKPKRISTVVSTLILLKERINIFHQINEAKAFYWTDLFPGMGDWFKRGVGICSDLVFVLFFGFFFFGLFILMLNYVLFSLYSLLPLSY